MISQTLMEKPLQLRLPAFRNGLREQISNPNMLHFPLKTGCYYWSIWNVLAGQTVARNVASN
jgi:hypothetical protein